MQALFDRLGWSARERKLATLLGAVTGVMLFLAGPIATEAWLRSRRAEYDDTRAALAAVQSARAAVRDRQTKKDAIALRYQRKAPQLAGYLEQTATAQKLQVADSVDRPEVPHGKRYTERNTVIHFKKAGMLALARFLEALEKSGYPLSLTRLSIRTRVGEKDSYDVEVGVSAYDRAEVKPESAAAGSAAPPGKVSP